MYTYTPMGPPGQTVDAETLVRAVLATARGGMGRVEDSALQTLYWLEVSGVQLTLDGEPFTTYGQSLMSLSRIFLEQRCCDEAVELAD